MILEHGYELINGSRVKKVRLYIPENPGKPLELNLDTGLTAQSQAKGLVTEYAKSPFEPKFN